MCSQSACAPMHHSRCSSPQCSRLSLESRAVSDCNCTVQSGALRLLGRAIISTLAHLVANQPQLLYLPGVTRFCFFLYYCFFFPNGIFQRLNKDTKFEHSQSAASMHDFDVQLGLELFLCNCGTTEVSEIKRTSKLFRVLIQFQ